MYLSLKVAQLKWAPRKMWFITILLNIKVFLWLAFKNSILTKGNLLHIGWKDKYAKCMFCDFRGSFRGCCHYMDHLESQEFCCVWQCFTNDPFSVVCKISYWLSNWACLQKVNERQPPVATAFLLSRLAHEAFTGHPGWAPSKRRIVSYVCGGVFREKLELCVVVGRKIP
jgi:hypothetical protein